MRSPPSTPAASPARLLILLGALGLLGASGGPDADGVVFVDSSEVDGPPHGLLDLSSAADLGLSDDGTTTISLPFDVEWYGTTVRQATISNNGTLFFSGASTTPVTTCPGGTGTWSGIAAFADDLGAGTVRTATLGRSPHRVFAVEWQVPHASVGGMGTVQVWLLEGGGRRQEAVIVLEDVTFGDASVDGGASAIIGVQPGDGASGLAWSCAGGLSDESTAWFGAEGARPASSRREDDTLEALWYGVDTRGYLGQSLALGDVNGDGLADLLAGQPQDDLAYLIYGSTGTTGDDILTTSATLFTWDGSTSPDLAAALQVTDLDGDGLADLFLSAPLDDTATTNAGALYGMAGGSGLPTTVSLPSDADLVLAGPSSVGDARAGYAFTARTDLDGDGYNDLVIGAPYADTNATQAGAVYLWYGHLSALDGRTDSLETGAAAVLNGEDAADWAGYAVDAQDLDGDGLAEILVGAPNVDDAANNAGAAYLVLGVTSAAASRDLHTDSHLLITGDGSDDKAGSAVALGDVDGDGWGDLLLGAPEVDDGASNAGAAYAFYGPTSLTGGTYGVASADVEILSTTANASLGQGIAALDLDDDGVQELLVAAPNDLAATSGGGSVRFLDAATAGAFTAGDALHVLVGTASAGQLGTAVAFAAAEETATDLNGDGYLDVVMGAPYADYGVTGAGRISLWSVQPDFEDADGDGFVTTASGGIDCDDGDAAIYPGAAEDDTNLLDDDCDGWIDGWLSLRLDPDAFADDLVTVLGTSDAEGAFDMEDASSGDLLDTHYSEQGLSFSADGYVTAAADVWGSQARDSLAARVSPTSSSSSLTLLFSQEVDALAFYALDVEEALEISAAVGGTLLFSGASLAVSGSDRPGGVYVGVLFAEPVDEVILTAEVSDAWGLDDLRLSWADASDRDDDGYTGDSGDCDDSNASIYPGAPEDLSNGQDDDCDGAVDGGSLEVYTTGYTDWSAAAALQEQVIDFEDGTVGDLITDDYGDLGVVVSDGTAEFSSEVDGAAPRDTLAAETGGSLTLTFDEVQPALALWLLDLDDTLSLEGYADGTLLYSSTVDVSGDDVDEGVFLGLVFDYGVDELVLSADAILDTWGLDDLIVSQLGLDDADGDGFTEAEGDCDDASSAASPDQTEVWYDGVDADCDGASDYDEDGDGQEASAYGGLDCDDGDSTVSPDAEEVWYDGVDQDCDALSDYDADFDGSDFFPDSPDDSIDCNDGDSTVSPDAEEVWYDGVDDNCDPEDDDDADGDGYAASGSGGLAIFGEGDCDDSSAEIGPDAEEIWYDGVDQDCDEVSDYDADGDGFDAEAYGGEDCHDTLSLAYPGAPGEVWYDGVDQDCDDASDDDADGDGYDRDGFGSGGDCNDLDAAIHPGAADTLGDGVDTNCDDAPEFDDDGDDFDDVLDGGADCDDTNAAISPDAQEIWYDGVDQDCDTASDYDADQDSHDSDVYGGDDCDDADASIHPGATDYYYDGIDNDCDGKSDFDVDGDGYPADWYGGDDCDDGDNLVSPGAVEVWYDGVDQDCDGASDYDADEDAADASAYGGRDCDDTDASIGPYVAEVPFDGIDQNCDGQDDVDADADGALSSVDCDDGDDSIYPGAVEICYDGVDSDCDALSDSDCDTDGFSATAYGGVDCDDSDDAISPNAEEVWYDGVDQDCDGADDYDADGDGHRPIIWGGGDCNDAHAQSHPGLSIDSCGEGDNDCDGTVDEDCFPDDTGTAPADDTGSSGGGPDSGDDSGDSADSAAGGETGGWVDPNAEWVPPASSTAGEVVGGKRVGCTHLSLTGADGGGLGLLVSLGIGAVVGGQRRRLRLRLREGRSSPPGRS